MSLPRDYEISGDIFITRNGKVLKRDEPDEFPLETEESLSTLLLRKSHEVSDLQDQLKQTRIDYFQRIKRCEEKEEELKRKQEAFSAHKDKFERFMKDNEVKRNRATSRSVDEAKEREHQEQEIKKILKDIEDLKDKKRNCETQLRDNRRFEKFLETVVFEDDYFESINDVLVRYKTLQRIKDTQLERINKNEGKIESTRHNYSNRIKSNQNDLLILSGKISEYKQKLERVQTDASSKEQELYETEGATATKVGELGECKFAISNLYNRARTKLKWNSDKILLAEKLDRISILMADLSDIINDFQKSSKVEKIENSKNTTK